MATTEHKFSMQETVLIKALNIQGVITHILIAYCGLEYKVRYFGEDLIPYEIYFYEAELKSIPKNPLKAI